MMCFEICVVGMFVFFVCVNCSCCSLMVGLVSSGSSQFYSVLVGMVCICRCQCLLCVLICRLLVRLVVLIWLCSLVRVGCWFCISCWCLWVCSSGVSVCCCVCSCGSLVCQCVCCFSKGFSYNDYRFVISSVIIIIYSISWLCGGRFCQWCCRFVSFLFSCRVWVVIVLFCLFVGVYWYCVLVVVFVFVLFVVSV